MSSEYDRLAHTAWAVAMQDPIPVVALVVAAIGFVVVLRELRKMR